jgi:LacI family transcriptional regulator
VHAATASRALNPDTRHLVNEATAERVIAAAAEMGYVPNPMARGLKTSRTTTIGVVIPNLNNALFPPIVRGIEDAMLAAGYTALLVNTDEHDDREEQLVRSLRSRQVDGFIFATARSDNSLITALVDEGVPVVLVNRKMDGTNIPAVTTDDDTGIHLAVRHLADLGHRHIAHLAGPSSTSTGRAREAAFRRACTELGLDTDERLIVPSAKWLEDTGAEATIELLARKVRFSAIVAANDLIALGALDVFYERDISCPGDVSLVGYNNIPMVDKLRPPLTTVAMPHYQIGLEAGRLLLQQINGEVGPLVIVLPLTLAIRESTGPVNASSPTMRSRRRSEAAGSADHGQKKPGRRRG